MKEQVDPIRTFEARTPLDDLGLCILKDMAEIYSEVIHTLFAHIQRGKNPKDLKSDFLKKYGITGRQFNAIRNQLDGKIASIEARIPLLIEDKKEKIARLEKKIPHYEKKPKIAHQKKRKLTTLKMDLEQLEKERDAGTVKMCFGSKKLWRAQFALEENGYESHKEWLDDWQEARSREIFFLGSHEESQGNQSCSLFEQEDGNFKLRVRLPNALEKKYGTKYLWIRDIKISYGRKEILAALELHKEKKGKALSFRLLKDQKGWRVFISLNIVPSEIVSKENIGVIGLDINANHLALTETDRFGNPLQCKKIPFNLKKVTSDQAEAILGDACSLAVSFAKQLKKPLILEDLDFSKKKASLKEKGVSYARMLSSFAYSKILYLLKSRALKKGIVTAEVNPAYTSLIGRVNFAARYGLSTHNAAALVIGRRFLQTSETPLSGQRMIPDGRGGHVTLFVSVRTRTEHVWFYLKRVNKEVLAAIKSHTQAAKGRSRGPLKPAPVTV